MQKPQLRYAVVQMASWCLPSWDKLHACVRIMLKPRYIYTLFPQKPQQSMLTGKDHHSQVKR